MEIKIKSNYVSKTKVTYVTADTSIADSRKKLIESGYRCIPVLDENHQTFKGLIYKEATSDYMIEGTGQLSDPVSQLLKNESAFVYEDTPFFKVLFTIRRLPFLAVLDQNGHFQGIVTHSKVMDILEDSYGIKKGGYSLTISTTEGKGSLKKLFSSIGEEYNIEGVFTQDAGKQFVRRIIITLNRTVMEEQVNQLVHKLEHSGFKVAEVEDLREYESAF
ncbi:cyclic di-AMP binding protein CbpA [Fictibacillus enclensis]|uniref:cyclic di-AMP binding protein CbpA n=1 Tax=Fictibacillus enclensis TaxID=1017270 RepID=UPI0025A13C68|nr:cyclic di-AMP binding protein CbpA [Fictibacillus enclensis]MDM5199172.1 cyclic di-AMP binding protein CbpA [Fictibacillus enclensis]